MCRVHKVLRIPKQHWSVKWAHIIYNHWRLFLFLGWQERLGHLIFVNSQYYPKCMCLQSFKDRWQNTSALPLVQQLFPLHDRFHPSFHCLSCDWSSQLQPSPFWKLVTTFQWSHMHAIRIFQALGREGHVFSFTG